MHHQSLTPKSGIFFTKQNFYLNFKIVFKFKFLFKYINTSPLVMTVPTSIPETLMVHTKHESLHRSEGTNTFIPMELIQCVLKTVMGIMDDEQIESFSHWCSTEVSTASLIFVIIFTISQRILTNMMNTE